MAVKYRHRTMEEVPIPIGLPIECIVWRDQGPEGRRTSLYINTPSPLCETLPTSPLADPSSWGPTRASSSRSRWMSVAFSRRRSPASNSCYSCRGPDQSSSAGSDRWILV